MDKFVNLRENVGHILNFLFQAAQLLVLLALKRVLFGFDTFLSNKPRLRIQR
jgi:hypothetical protein